MIPDRYSDFNPTVRYTHNFGELRFGQLVSSCLDVTVIELYGPFPYAVQLPDYRSNLEFMETDNALQR